MWAQEEIRKSLGIAGAKVVDEVLLAVPGSVNRFAETHPEKDAEVIESLCKVLDRLSSDTMAA